MDTKQANRTIEIIILTFKWMKLNIELYSLDCKDNIFMQNFVGLYKNT